MPHKSARKRSVNRLRKILAIQTEYLKHKQEGISTRYVFNHYIRDKFYITERTFWRYLAINAKRELKLLEENEAAEMAA